LASQNPRHPPPHIQEHEQRLRCEGARVLELPVFLADHQLAVSFCYRQGRNAFVQRHIKLFHHIGILLFVLSQVDVYHFIGRHRRCEVGPMKRQVQHVAVKTPVRAKNQQHPLVLGCGFFFRFLDLGVRIRIRRINIPFHVRWLFQVGIVRSFNARQPPLVSLLSPSLAIGNSQRLAIGQKHFSFENDARAGGPLLHADDFQLYALRFQTKPETHVRVGIDRDPVGHHLRLWIRAVRRFQRRRISCDNRILPLVQRCKTRR